MVVGFDGSDASQAALEHAVDLAGPDGRVFVVHSYELPSGMFGGHEYDRAIAERQRHGRGLLEHIDSEAHDAAVETELIGGDAAAAIDAVARSRDATAIVVGSRGTGRVRALLGSVSHELLSQASCPVVVIPARAVEASRERAAAHSARGS